MDLKTPRAWAESDHAALRARSGLPTELTLYFDPATALYPRWRRRTCPLPCSDNLEQA
jgi:hypothetical protein